MENKSGTALNHVRVDYKIIKSTLEQVLLKEGFSEYQAAMLAKIFAENSLYGKDSHGVNRFCSFVSAVREGYVKTNAEPQIIKENQAFEQWDGNYGAGPLNAKFCTDRAIELAGKHGIGCVALKNTNHWMRGGTYGQLAAEKGFILICWTNAVPTMPPWGGSVPKLGNNPLVIGIPYKDKPIVLDFALSQFSYGKLEKLSQANLKTDFPAGYDDDGSMTNDPAVILKNKKALPVGLWKGSGLALVLDLIAAILSGGRTSLEIGKEKTEYGVSQVFIAFKPETESSSSFSDIIIKSVLDDLKNNGGENIYYPGELSAKLKEENLKLGVPVDKVTWDEVLKMR